MLTLLVRRARAQWPLEVSLLLLVLMGTTLLGTGALLLTRTAGRALAVAATRAAPDDMAATAYLVTIGGTETTAVDAVARDVLTRAYGTVAVRESARASSVMRSYDGRRETYLSGVDDPAAVAGLVSGGWPAGPGQAAVLQSTAEQLGLAVGDTVRLGPELTANGGPAVAITVTGIIRPSPGSGWDRDPLDGAGWTATFASLTSPAPVPAYGPFLMRLSDLYATRSALAQLEITARPDLSAPRTADLTAATAGLLAADRALERAAGDRVEIERVQSALPATLTAARDQQRVVGAAVLSAGLIGAILTAAALALAGRLVAGVRTTESGLLSALGFGPGRLAAIAFAEASLLTLVAAVLAVPASSCLHAGITHLPSLAGAGLAVGPGVAGVQVLAIAAGALMLAVVLIVFALRSAVPPVLARSGADLVLAVFAAAGWWQLRDQPADAGTGVDLIRVLAPAVLLLAGAALALRLVRPTLRGAERLARRARGLVLPLSILLAARRPRATAAALLITFAAATATFGIAFGATWNRSYAGQAALSVGTDLAVGLNGPAMPGQGAAIAAAAGASAGPVATQGIAVGQWLGADGEGARLVAVNAADAGDLLRGRLDGGRTWAEIGARLRPAEPVGGLDLPAGAAPALTGTATGAATLTVTPQLLLQDEAGLRFPCTDQPVRLDGKRHRLTGCAFPQNVRLIAVALPVAVAGEFTYGTTIQHSQAAITLTVPGVTGPGPPWTGAAPAAGGLTMSSDVAIQGSAVSSSTPIAYAFGPPGPVPVAVSSRFADELGAGRGQKVNIAVGTTTVPVLVAEVVPAVPSAPGAAAVLADLDALTRAMVAAGNLNVPTDAWWVGDPGRPDAAERVSALDVGTVITRAGESARLTTGPLGVGLPAMLSLLAPAAVVLLIAGLILHVTTDLRERTMETSRLRGLGLTGRDIRQVLLSQYVGMLVPLITAGAAVGALVSATVAPLLVRSQTGAVPVPSPLPVWPWTAEVVLLAVLLAGSVLAVGPAVVTTRADAATMRTAS